MENIRLKILVFTVCSLLLLFISSIAAEAQDKENDSGVFLPEVPLISVWEHQGSVNLGPAVEKVGFNTAWSHEGPWRTEPFELTMTYRHLNTPGIEYVIAMVSREQWGWGSHEESMQHAARVAVLSLLYPEKFIGIYMNDYYYEIEETEGLPGRNAEQFAEIIDLVRKINPKLPIWVPIYPNNHLNRSYDFDFDCVICNIYDRNQVPHLEEHLNATIEKFEGKKPIMASLYIARGTAEDGWMGEEEFRNAMDLFVRYINEGKIIGFRIFRAAQLYQRPEYMEWIREALVNLDPKVALKKCNAQFSEAIKGQ